MKLGRILFSTLGGSMILLGSVAVAYGVLMPEMYAIFDKYPALILGLALTLTGGMVVARGQRSR